MISISGATGLGWEIYEPANGSLMRIMLRELTIRRFHIHLVKLRKLEMYELGALWCCLFRTYTVPPY
jgi:hypothetical protein